MTRSFQDNGVSLDGLLVEIKTKTIDCYLTFKLSYESFTMLNMEWKVYLED